MKPIPVLTFILMMSDAAAQTIIPYDGPTDEFDVGYIIENGPWEESDAQRRFAVVYPKCQIFRVSEREWRGRMSTAAAKAGRVVTAVAYFQSDKCPP